MDQDTLPQRLHSGFQFVVRYLVGSTLIFYAAPKWLGVQFQVFRSTYDTPLGDVSGFWMAWAFFAHSYYYQFLIGLAETTIAFLLFWRRTKTIGVLCALPIVTNVLLVDHFFRVDSALPVAIALFLGVLYLFALEFPLLRRFLWEGQKGASSSRTLIGSFAYGAAVLFASLGFLMYLVRTSTLPQEGAYRIESYSANGIPRVLTAGRYGRDPMLYFEFNKVAVQSVDGRSTRGSYTFDSEKREFTLTADRSSPDAVLSGTYQVDGEGMRLHGRQGEDEVEIVLRRVRRDAH